MTVHISSCTKNYSDILTTVHLTSRIHRMRRRKTTQFVAVGTANGSGGSSGEDLPRMATCINSEPDPSSSDLSADTVIYVGPGDEATDGEHPPVYIPSLNSGDNRCAMSKALRGSLAEQRQSKVPISRRSDEKSSSYGQSSKSSQSTKPSPPHTSSSKASPNRLQSAKPKIDNTKHSLNGNSDEQWIDGPRISKLKVAEARHIRKEPCHVKKRETWIDGPMQSETPLRYGYMDSHKKNMIRKWVEHQTSQIQRTKQLHGRPQVHKGVQRKYQNRRDEDKEEYFKPLQLKQLDHFSEPIIAKGLKMNTSKNYCNLESPVLEDYSANLEEIEEDGTVQIPPPLPLIQPLSSREVSLESLDVLLKERMLSNAEYNSYQSKKENGGNDDELEIIEVEEPLEPIPTQDCGLQVTEEDIALCMGLSEKVEEAAEHPLRILSQENLTVASTFTDSMSIYTDLEPFLPKYQYGLKYNLHNDDYEDLDNPRHLDKVTQQKFDQLARLHELYSDRLAKAHVTNSETFQQEKLNHEITEPLYNGIHDTSSIYSEPVYLQEQFCENCNPKSEGPTNTQNWYADIYISASTQDLTNTKLYQPPLSGRFQRYSHKYTKDSLTYLRHPDGASNPNLQELPDPENYISNQDNNITESFPAKSATPMVPALPVPPNSLPSIERTNRAALNFDNIKRPPHKSEGYDSGHDSTPRTSKLSPAAISRRAESGYDSIVRDSESSSIDSDTSRPSRRLQNRRSKCKHKHDKSFCSWFLKPFTCKYIDEQPETHF